MNFDWENWQTNLELKSGKAIPNTMISTHFTKYDGKIIVEFWDVTKDYHSLLPIEDDFDALDESVKSFYSKYRKGQKRKSYTKEEFDEIFTVSKSLTLKYWFEHYCCSVDSYYGVSIYCQITGIERYYSYFGQNFNVEIKRFWNTHGEKIRGEYNLQFNAQQ